MAQNNSNKQRQVSANNNNKGRKGDTGRTSTQGQKTASGGSANTNNKGHRKGS